MKWCLLPSQAENFKEKLKTGEIRPDRMAAMTSVQRREFLEPIVGKENAMEINANFESKLLLKNQQAGMVTWAKHVVGLKETAKRDLISRIERLDKVLSPSENEQFLQDLASSRLGLTVTEAEAKQIYDLTKQVQELKAKANSDGVFASEVERLAYGKAQVNFENYINELKLENRKVFGRNPLKLTTDAIKATPGTLKSLVSSLDNSFLGRQGIKTLLDVRTAPIWAKTFVRSWGLIGKELAGKDAMLAVKAEIYSRPNALNGKYKAGKYGLDVLSEEAFPSSLPAKIPVLRRIYKASESAYNGSALRMRADLADRLIRIAERNGVNTLNKTEAEGIGRLVGSLTGRSPLGAYDRQLNVLLFSVKFMKANFDTLTAHQLDPKATPFAKKEAAKSLFSMVASIAALLTIAKMIDPDSVEDDPRSTHFGKIKIFGQWVDITGGMSAFVTLASRITPSYHNGQWGFWQKTSSGYKNLASGAFGATTALDVAEGFIEGRLSPALGVIRDIWKGKTYSGEKPTPENLAKGVVTPITLQNFIETMNDPEASNKVGSLILDGLGFSVTTNIYPVNWEGSTSKTLQQFKAAVGDAKFNEANDRFNREYKSWVTKVQATDSYKNLSDEGKASLLSSGKSEIQKEVLDSYNFKYKRETNPEKDEIDSLKP